MNDQIPGFEGNDADLVRISFAGWIDSKTYPDLSIYKMDAEIELTVQGTVGRVSYVRTKDGKLERQQVITVTGIDDGSQPRQLSLVADIDPEDEDHPGDGD